MAYILPLDLSTLFLCWMRILLLGYYICYLTCLQYMFYASFLQLPLSVYCCRKIIFQWKKRYGLHGHIKSSINSQVAEIATLDNVYYIIFIHGYQINCLQCLLWVSKCVFPVKKIQNLFEFIWCLVSKLKKKKSIFSACLCNFINHSFIMHSTIEYLMNIVIYLIKW